MWCLLQVPRVVVFAPGTPMLSCLLQEPHVVFAPCTPMLCLFQVPRVVMFAPGTPMLSCLLQEPHVVFAPCTPMLCLFQFPHVGFAPRTPMLCLLKVHPCCSRCVAGPGGSFVSIGACNLGVPGSNPGRDGYLSSWLCVYSAPN